MKCPHCLTDFHDHWRHIGVDENLRNEQFTVSITDCPTCKDSVITLRKFNKNNHAQSTTTIYPKGTSRAPLSTEVPDKFAKDYREACTVLADSPKASAALSRRCLQNLLRETAKVPASDLSKEIDAVLNSKQLPTYLANAIDAVRNIGNFAAHPIKATSTGGIVDVEPGEAEWSLDVLEGLFDFYFIQPALIQKKRDALNAKLTQSGKPSMK